MLQVLMQDVGSVGEEVRPHVGRSRTRQFVQVLDDLVFAIAPREVGVALLEADFRERLHHRWFREGFGEEENIGVGGIDGRDQPIPEPQRLGVRVVDSKDADTAIHPHAHDAFDLRVQTLGILLEVQRIDVLVLLGRILRVSDRAIVALAEPFRVCGNPRVIGGCLQSEIEGDLHAELFGACHECIEVLPRTQVRVQGIVSAVATADSPR